MKTRAWRGVAGRGEAGRSGGTGPGMGWDLERTENQGWVGVGRRRWGAERRNVRSAARKLSRAATPRHGGPSKEQ